MRKGEEIGVSLPRRNLLGATGAGFLMDGWALERLLAGGNIDPRDSLSSSIGRLFMVGGVSILKIISRGHRFLAQSNKGEVRRTVDDVEWKVGVER